MDDEANLTSTADLAGLELGLTLWISSTLLVSSC
jgi:hypothetical protein